MVEFQIVKKTTCLVLLFENVHILVGRTSHPNRHNQSWGRRKERILNLFKTYFSRRSVPDTLVIGRVKLAEFLRAFPLHSN